MIEVSTIDYKAVNAGTIGLLHSEQKIGMSQETRLHRETITKLSSPQQVALKYRRDVALIP